MNESRMRVLILGVGDAFTRSHFNTSALIQAPQGYVLLDCPALIHRVLRESTGPAGWNVQLDDIQDIIITHLHGDHTGGNEAFGKNSHIIAHKNVRKRLSTQTRGGDKSLPPMPAIGLPVITFDEGLSLHFNGEEIKVMHFSKGHTDGDAIIYFTKSNVYHLSDYYFEGRFPYVDLENGGNVANYLENVDKMILMISDDAKIVPGHGNVTSLDELKEYRSMLRETVKYVWNKMSRHQSLEDIIEKGLPKKYKKWHWNFITEKRWIETIYESYISLVAN